MWPSKGTAGLQIKQQEWEERHETDPQGRPTLWSPELWDNTSLILQSPCLWCLVEASLPNPHALFCFSEAPFQSVGTGTFGFSSFCAYVSNELSKFKGGLCTFTSQIGQVLTPDWGQLAAWFVHLWNGDSICLVPVVKMMQSKIYEHTWSSFCLKHWFGQFNKCKIDRYPWYSYEL
jgi:hypothetical protein